MASLDGKVPLSMASLDGKVPILLIIVIILCSPSPGSLESEIITLLSISFLNTFNSLIKLSINFVPGVILLEFHLTEPLNSLKK